MKLEDIKQKFPPMPREIRDRIEQEVQKQVGAPVRRQSRPARKLGRTLLIAAAVVVVLVMTAFAAYQYGVKDILTEKGISLTGDKNSSEYQANQEWNAYVDEYMETFDWDEAEEPDGYEGYQVYDWEMADMLDTIAEKYQLELQTAGSIPFGEEETAYELLGTEDFLLLEHEFVTGYAFGNGTFKMENAAILDGERVDYSIYSSEKDILNAIWDAADLGIYEEWTHETESGAVANLVLGGNNSLILLETEDSYITVQIDSGTMNIAPGMEEYEEAVESIAANGTPAQTAEEMYAEFQERWSLGRVLFTREKLEAFADGIDFEALGNINGFGDAVYEEYQNDVAASRAADKLFVAAEDELGSFCLSTEVIEEFPHLTNKGMPSGAEEGTAAYAVWRFEADDGRYISLRYQRAEGTLDDMVPWETPENGTLERVGVGGDIGPDDAYLAYDEQGELKKLLWIDEAKELLFVLETGGASEEELLREALYLVDMQALKQTDPEAVYAQLGEYRIGGIVETHELGEASALTSGQGENWFGRVYCVYERTEGTPSDVILCYESVVDEDLPLAAYVSWGGTVTVRAYTTVNGHEAVITENVDPTNPIKEIEWLDEEKGLYFWMSTALFDNTDDVIALAETVTLAE